ncbi:MAG TPA: AAA family ATPase [Planctomycetota bacterium]
MPAAPEAGGPTLEQAHAKAAALTAALGERFLGQHEIVELAFAALLADGHVLIEGAPGTGKTRLVRSLAALLDMDFGRVQCTPDLMPGDVTGGEVLEDRGGERGFRFLPGPVFCNVLLADEINRATPRTQSALLEAMEERQVTAGGTSHQLPAPFFVAATQNPIELEGTYPLPEAQLDRFLFKLEVGRPDAPTLQAILALPAASAEPALTPLLGPGDVGVMQALARQIPLPDGMLEQVGALVLASHPDSESAPPEVAEHVRFGASARAGRAALAGARALALIRGRAHVAPQDLLDALGPAFRHRLLLRYEAAAAGLRADVLIAALLRSLPVR